jgi:Ca2+-binding RTX toxin-like protein
VEDFEVKPLATPGRVQFDRTGPTPPGPFNLDIGTAENLQLNAGGGNDRIRGARGLAGLIKSSLNGDDGNDRIVATDGEDSVSGGKGLDVINTRDKAADAVECGPGFDLAFVDRRDTVRGCEIVLGGRLRVRHLGAAIAVSGGSAAVKLRCVAARGRTGKVALVRGGKSLGGKSFRLRGRKARTVHIKLRPRGLRLLANAPDKGLRIKLRIDARDSAGNGWRTADSLRLER